jgi:hypothetical protein
MRIRPAARLPRCLLVGLCLVVPFVWMLPVSIVGRSAIAQEQAAVRPFTLTLATFSVTGNDAPVLQYIMTRFVRSRKCWKQIRTDVKTHDVRVQQAVDSGVYDVKTDKHEFLSASGADDVPITPEGLSAHPQVERTEQVLGTTAYVLHNAVDDQTWGEFYYTPATGWIPIKIVTSHGGGSNKTIVEPMSLSFGDIPDSVLKEPNRPISYERIQQMTDSAEKNGQHDYGEALRRSVAESQNKAEPE